MTNFTYLHSESKVLNKLFLEIKNKLSFRDHYPDGSSVQVIVDYKSVGCFAENGTNMLKDLDMFMDTITMPETEQLLFKSYEFGENHLKINLSANAANFLRDGTLEVKLKILKSDISGLENACPIDSEDIEANVGVNLFGETIH